MPAEKTPDMLPAVGPISPRNVDRVQHAVHGEFAVIIEVSHVVR